MSRRKPSALDQLADQYVEQLQQLEPDLAIGLGHRLVERAFADYSAFGAEQRATLAKRTLSKVQNTSTADATDVVTKMALVQSLNGELAMHEAGLSVGNVGNIATPMQSIRDAFALMPTVSTRDWEDISRRLHAVPEALDTYRAGIETAIDNGHAPTRTQTEALLEDLRAQISDSNPYKKVVETPNSPAPMNAQLQQASLAATEATAGFAQWIKERVRPVAVNQDAVGRQNYRLHSMEFLGMRIDPEETYDWALEELRRIHAQQVEIARELYGANTTVTQALANLDKEERYQLRGTDALKKWMQQVADQAIEDLAGKHFTVTEPIRHIECMIASSADGGIYYTAPSADFSRPGQMWWSVPPGQEVFHTWQEKTTVYHEGMPGHHMQLGRATALQGRLNTWRANVCWYPGHGEGWALYAEALMDQLGYLTDPGERMGMLDSQRLRAARVVVDIGLHCELRRPSTSYLQEIGITEREYEAHLQDSPYRNLGQVDAQPGGWDRNHLWAFMASNVAMQPAFLQFETTRYLGWPGQASAYKVGQHQWELTRDHYLAQPDPVTGERRSLRQFHDEALALGGLPLSVLDRALNNDE
ncbi:DUF885 domain-containing protein [Gleimia hominis]|uniref:DUF885 domain-containing protein n=1 Tax=Gleimia hominis TaxID=595468 RepID=UPI000C7FDCA1|nr:DUF885 domain-containing protein [Gleimia hominis]WIK63706.1 DUF885 domain-containing protein [Gleimia hominis]